MTKKSKIGSLNGTCKLTKKEGTFVKSHLIPNSLTRPAIKGSYLIQYGNKSSLPVKRWSSWYDQKLVIQEGEDILTEIDTWAITALRKQKLVWSSWGAKDDLGNLHNVVGDNLCGIRKIENFNSEKLRLFFLSLLWRAASSELSEFSEVTLPPEDLEQLRLMLISRDTKPSCFYPITLIQLSTKGAIHNQTPFYDIKDIVDPMYRTVNPVPIYRFYFDGLIAHIHIQNKDDKTFSELGSLLVGEKNDLVVVTQTYEKSFQKQNLIRIIANDLAKN